MICKMICRFLTALISLFKLAYSRKLTKNENPPDTKRKVYSTDLTVSIVSLSLGEIYRPILLVIVNSGKISLSFQSKKSL